MRLPALPRLPALSFSGAEWLFSAKSFAAAMLALFLAQWIGLPRPFWSLLTVYVVSQPLAGTVRSKALYRFCGTLLGSTATVVLVPTLSNAPELLAGALALWVAACLYISLLDRTPRAYVFMLAGYTAALIGFPSVEAPQLIFETAVARVEEILLGIACATLVHSLVFPTGLTPSLIGLLDRTLGDARHWLQDLLRTDGRAFAHEVDRRRLATDITQLRLLSTHVPFDTTHLAWTAGALRSMQDGVAALTPVFAAVEDRLRALQEAEGGLATDVSALLAQVSAWLDAGAGDTRALRLSLAAFGQDPREHGGWHRALRLGLAARLVEMIEGWQLCAQLRQDIEQGLAGAPVPPRKAPGVSDERSLHRDHGMAALSAFAAFLAVGLACAFWMFTAWPAGSAAAMMAAVFCSFFASQDDPVPLIHGFLKFTLWSVPIAAFYVLVLLPLVTDMASLALACAPAFLLLGLYIARPGTAAAAMAVVLGLGGALSGHDTGQADFTSFINSMTGQVLGIVIAGRTTRLVRSVGADWMARRIQRVTQRELAGLAAGSMRSEGFAARLLDRIGLIAPRVADSDSQATREALRDLRLGADIVALQHSLAELPQATANGIRTLLTALSRAWPRPEDQGSPALLAQLDDSLAAALNPGPSETPRLAIAALLGLRRNLFITAPPARVPALQENPQ